MVLEHYISELLYRYNCIVVPGFGAFLSQHQSAIVNEQTNAFYPPTKSLSFNGQLTSNDGLLVSYIAEAEEKTYEEALHDISSQIDLWNANLKRGERLSFERIGELKLSTENKIQFKPSQQVNYLTSSFGLASFVSTPVTREVLKVETEQIEDRVPFIITPERRKESKFRPYLKYAAIILLALSAGFTGYRTYMQSLNNQQIVAEKAKEEVNKSIQEATFFSTAPLELPTLNIEAVSNTPTQGIHHIVAGAFRFKNNADRKIEQLKSAGFDAAYFGTNDHGLHMVTYSSHTEVEEALQSLKKIKSTQSKDAWLLSVR